MDPPVIIQQLKLYLNMIKLSHTLFALPFALSSYCLACQKYGWNVRSLFWIVIAMVCARSAGMGFNRWIDRDIDATNPRTQNRILPQKKIHPNIVKILISFFTLGFMIACWQLNQICFFLSPVALLFIFGYSYSKRYSYLSHWLLGIALAISPIGAWIAVTNSFHEAPWSLFGTVLLWVAGFDILYACQDFEFDQSQKLYSIPSVFGIQKSLIIAKICHLISWLLMGLCRHQYQLSLIFIIGWLLIGSIFIYEHFLIHRFGLAQIHKAFFIANSYISVIFFGFILLSMR